jgi:uncharacterized protein
VGRRSPGRAVNPFDAGLATANSNYSVYSNGRLAAPEGEDAPSPLTRFVHDELRGLVLNDLFSCDGGKAALRGGRYAFGLYESLESVGSIHGLSRDLYRFVTDIASTGAGFTTFIASFNGPHPVNEAHFERTLWSALQQLADLDSEFHPWAAAGSDDPNSPQFSFSFAEMPFFIIGLHAASSRVARRFAWPTLVFNPHRQFDELRRSGRFQRFQQVIRRAELALQGSTNPMLADHGSSSEARQYSGRLVDDQWQCPFHVRSVREPTTD